MTAPLIDPSLGFYLNMDLSEQDAVRKSSRLLDRIENRLMSKLFPSGVGVRGKFTAADSIVEAVIREGKVQSYDLFANPNCFDRLRSRLVSSWGAASKRVGLHSFDSLLDHFDDFSLITLISPDLTCDALKLRNHAASRPTPVVMLTHGFSLHTLLHDTFLQLLLSDVQACDSIICTSHASQAAMTQTLAQVCEHFNCEYGTRLKYHGRVDRIPICVDTNTLVPKDKIRSRSKFRLPPDAMVLLFLGRISPLKADLIPLLTVFKDLTKANPDKRLILIIAGSPDEPYTQILKEYVTELGLTKKVRFIFNTPDLDKPALFSAADIFVAPADSLLESFGVAVVEAMSCGLPQVAANWDGYRDTVEDGKTGILVPTMWTRCDQDLAVTGSMFGWEFDHYQTAQSIAMDLSSLKGALQVLIENDTLRQDMSRESRLRAESVFSYSVVARQYEQLSWNLHEIAGTITINKKDVSYDRPSYFDRFSLHASHILKDEQELVLTSLCDEKHGRWLLRSRTSAGEGIEADDTNLILKALDICYDCSTLASSGAHRVAKSITFGDLLAKTASPLEQSLPPAKRAIMWLIKQGYLRLR